MKVNGSDGVCLTGTVRNERGISLKKYLKHKHLPASGQSSGL